jgi:NTE family protein
VANKKSRTAIVFQGGGAYGAYELGAFKALWDNGIKPDVVTGVSIGAVNAAVIAGCKNDDPPKALDELWRRLTVIPMPGLPDWLHHLLTMPYNPGMYSLNTQFLLSPFTATSYSDTGLLKDTLNDIVDWKKLNKGAIKLAVTALNVGTGKLTVFRNYKDPKARSQDVGPPITADHIIASGSLPPAFPMTQIDEDSYWDGGLFSNTPLKPAFKALQAINDGAAKDVQRKIIVLALFPPAGKIPENMVEVETRKTDVAFGCKIDSDVELYKKIKEFRKFADLVTEQCEGNKSLTEKLTKNEGYKKLMSYKTVDELLRIDLDGEESQLEQKLMPGADFTKKTIMERSGRGYDITTKKLLGKK